MTRRAGKQAMADVPAAPPQQREEEEENVTRRVGKELVEVDVPAAPLQREDEEESKNKNKNKNKRIQVEFRHNKMKFHFGSFYDKRKADCARDYSLYFKLSCQPSSDKDKYHYQLSPTIFEKYECHPDKLPLVPIFKQLHQQPICGKGKSKDEKLVHFCKTARNRIKEMVPDLMDALSKDDLKDATMDKLSHAKVVVMEQLADKDWVLLGEFIKIYAKGRLMDIIWSRYLSEGFSFEHDYQGHGHHATSALQEENISAAKTLVLEQIDDKDWLMLGEFVPIVGIGYIIFTLCNSLSEVSPFEQDYLGDAHYETPVHPLERNSGYASFDHAQSSTTREASAGPSSNTYDQVLMNQSSGIVDSALQHTSFKSFKTNLKEYPFISREDNVWWCKDLE